MLPAIRVESLSKRYRIGSRVKRQNLREMLANKIAAPFSALGSAMRGRARDRADATHIWALKDVSLEVQPGEVVGVIGRNGSGKSTLLKILSRITEPTAGMAELNGPAACLLEIGTGFHPDLTGRDNIFLNGAILGMKKADIERRFDEIVAFAEVGQFIDTPVKHYSSGMYVRLAFAVAAHLESQILFVDEVLAVGDLEFQQKCLAKMEEAGKSGRTVLFVSHNLLSVTRLCSRAILLDQGAVRRDGTAEEVVGYYARDTLNAPGAREWPDPAAAPTGQAARLRAVRLRSEDGSLIDSVDIRRPLGVEIEFEVLKAGYKLLPNLRVDMADGVRAFSAYDIDPGWKGRPRPTGRYVTTAWIPGNLLNEGPMFISVGMVAVDPGVWQFYVSNVVAFQVIDSVAGDGARGDYYDNISGAVRPLLNWTTRWSGESTSHEAIS